MRVNKLLSELIGTFALVFAGTGAIIVNDVTAGSISHVGISLTFGLIVMTMIFAVGHVSGAHFNPAVTVGFWLAGRLPVYQVIPYILSQLVGGLVASFLLRVIFPQHLGLGMTLPSIEPWGALVFEAVLTFLLMFVIIHVTSGASSTGWFAGIAIGGTVCLDALMGGPVTGASMNPVRSLAPALILANFEMIWIYLTAPFVGAGLAVALFQLTKEQANSNHEKER